MSFIHYKLITNKTFEKITFDGVSLSVFDLKKIILEKKFRKQITAPTQNGITTSNTMPNKKNSDVDLEITNADTNEVYLNDTDLIPKNSRVRINRVVKTVGPAIAGGTVTSTQKQKEQLVNLRERFNHYANSPSYGHSPNSSPLNDFSGNDQKLGDDSRDFSSMNEESNSNSSCSLPLSECRDNLESLSPLVSGANITDDNKRVIAKIKVTIPRPNITGNKTESPPSTELLCPFLDESESLHLIQNAVIVPCCGYFICCEVCIRDRINKTSFLECPHEGCIQEITSTHRLTPYKPIRQKVIEYLNQNPSFTGLKTVPTKMVVIHSIQPSSNRLADVKQSSPATFTPVKLNIFKPSTPESQPVQEIAENLEKNEENISNKERSRSLSRSGSSRTTSRSRSSNSNSSRMSSKSSTDSVKTSLQSEVASSADKIRRTPTPTVSEPVPILNTEKPHPQVYVNQGQHFNGQPFFGQEQQMFYNQQNIQLQQQQNYYRNYIPPHPHHVNQHMPGFGNFTKQVAPPPGTEHFIQSHFQQQHQQFHAHFNQPQFNINQSSFSGQFPPIHQPPGFINGNFAMNQYNQQWPNQQLAMQQQVTGIINGPIKMPSTHRSNYNQRQTFHPENRSRSRSRSRHSKKYKRKYSRDRRSRSRDRRSRTRSRSRDRHSRTRSRSRNRRSRSRHEKRSRVDSKKSSYRSRRSRSRSRSFHKSSDSTKNNGNNKEVVKANGTYKSSHSKRSRSKSRDRHMKKSSRDERKLERKLTKTSEIESVKKEVIQAANEEKIDVKEAKIENSTIDTNLVKERVPELIEATAKNKMISQKLSLEVSSPDSSSASSSPSKSKRKVFLRHEILQQALQNSSPLKLTYPKEKENHISKAAEDLSEVNPVSPIENEDSFNARASLDQTVNEYEEYLDINVSENLSLA